jgi:hypothetical protein
LILFQTVLKSVEIFDSTNETTTKVPDMNGKRSYHQSIKHENDVYVIGGYNNGTLNTVKKININNFSSGWTQINVSHE